MSSGGGNRVSGDGGAARTSVNRDFNNATFNRTPTNTASNANRNVNVSNGEIANSSNRAANVNRANINNANINNANINNANINNANINNANINRTNVNNVNVNGYGGNYHLDNDVDYGWGHPVAAGAAFGAAAAVTSAAIGSVVYSLPPSCTVTVVNGISYQNCGGVWYEPQFSGTSVEYIVVSAPK